MNSVLPSAAEGQRNGVGSRFGLRWLDAAFVLRQLCILHVSCWMSGEKERHSQSGVKPPHSKGEPSSAEQKPYVPGVQNWAKLAGNAANVLGTLHSDLCSPEHREFVSRLQNVLALR
jgi:hypothetical protein